MTDTKVSAIGTAAIGTANPFVFTAPTAHFSMNPLTINFRGQDGLLFTIKSDGEIVRGPQFTTEDAMSLRFWEMIAETFPQFVDGQRRRQ